jgi:hypothetical protein
LIEGLVDIKTSMSIMLINVFRELGIMHLMAEHETYKITYGIVTRNWKNYKTCNESGKDYMSDGFFSV